MNKVKEWIKKYSLIIIICLIVLLFGKTCSNNSNKRRHEYTINKYEYTIDSISNINKQLTDSIIMLNHENKILNDVLVDVKKDKEYYIKQNRNLVNVVNDANAAVKNLSHKSNKKDTL